MKKIISIISIFIFALFSTVFIVSAASSVEVNYTPTLQGVRIRATTSESLDQGFKFTANVDDTVNFEVDDNILAHGFYMAKGTYTYEEITSAILNGESTITESIDNVYEGETARTSNIIAASVNGTENVFSVTFVGLENENDAIQTKNFLTNVTVVAFVKIKVGTDANGADIIKYFFNTKEQHRVRSISQVALNTLDPEKNIVGDYAYNIALATSEYFVRSEISDTKVRITSDFLDVDGNIIRTDGVKENEFIRGKSLNITLPTVTSKYYSELGYSDGTNSYSLGETVKLEKGEYELTFDGWDGTAFVRTLTQEEVNGEVLEDGQGGYYSSKMLFSNISDAANTAGVSNIFVDSGVYEEDIVIPNSNITLIGVNNDRLGTEDRITESEIIGTVTLGSGVDNITIKGFKFSGNSSLGVEKVSVTSVNKFNNENIQFINNYVDVNTIANGFINLNDVEKWHSKDLIVDGNYFTGSTTKGMIYTISNMNISVTNNIFENITNGKAIYLDDGNTNGVDGNLNISDNYFSSIAGEGIYIDYLAVPAYSTETIFEYKINNNIFNNMTADGIEFVSKVNLNGSENTLFQINGNTFTNLGGKGIIFPTSFSTSGSLLDFSISNNEFENVSSAGIVFTAMTITIANENVLFKINNNNFNMIGDKTIQLSNIGGTFKVNGLECDIQINDNTISQATGTAIWASTISSTATNKTSISVSGNEISDSLYDGICLNNVNSSSQVSTLNINNNVINNFENSNTGYKGDGIYISNLSVQEFNIVQNDLATGGNGIFVNTLNSDKVNFNNNKISNIASYAIYFGAIDSLDIKLNENNINAVKNAIWINNMNNTNVSSLEINSNKVIGSSNVAFNIENSASAQTFNSFTINYNEFEDCYEIANIGLSVTEDSCSNLFNYNIIPVTNQTIYVMKSSSAVIDCKDNYHLNGEEAVTDYDVLSAANVYNYEDNGDNVINYGDCIVTNDHYISTITGVNASISGDLVHLFQTLQVTITGSPISVTYNTVNGDVVRVDDNGLVIPISVGKDIIIVTIETIKGTFDVEFEVTVYGELDFIVVDSRLDETNTTTIYNEKEYILGLDAFASITDALNASKLSTSEEVTIYVFSGTYNESFTITESNTTLLGANSVVLGTDERNDETVLTGTITLGAKVNNTTIQGFKFTGNSYIQVDPSLPEITTGQQINNEGINFINNYVDVILTLNGFLNLTDKDRYHSKNVVINGNYFTGDISEGIVSIGNNVNVTITNNTFKNVSGRAISFTSTNNCNGISGNLNVSENIFDNITDEVFYSDYLYTFNSVYSSDDSTVSVKLNNNTITNSSLNTNAIFFDVTANLNSSFVTTFELNNNTFDTIGNGIYFEYINSNKDTTVFEMNKNTFRNVSGAAIKADKAGNTSNGQFKTFTINNNTISNVNDGIYITAFNSLKGLSITGNNITSATNYGIYLGTINSSDIRINENNINTVKNAIWINSMNNTNVSSLEINSNTITNVEALAIDIENSASAQTFNNFTINYNEFDICNRVLWVTMSVTNDSCTNYFSYNKIPVTASSVYAARSTNCVIDCRDNYHLNGEEAVTDYEVLSATNVYGHNSYGANVINYGDCITSDVDYIMTLAEIEINVDTELIIGTSTNVIVSGNYTSIDFEILNENIAIINQSRELLTVGIGQTSLIITIETYVGSFSQEIIVNVLADGGVIKFYNGNAEISELEMTYKYVDEKQLPSYEQIGYSFIGWSLTEDGKNIISKISAGTSGDIKLYLVSELIDYKAIFYKGDKEITEIEFTFTINDAITLPEYNSNGCEFVGWFADSAFNKQMFEIEKGTIGDQIFYLKEDVINNIALVVSENKYPNGTYIEYKGFNFITGKNVFTTISDAVKNVASGGNVYVSEGTYNQDVVVDADGITFIGNDDGINPINRNRSDKTIVSGTVTIKASNITFNGFDFTGSITSTGIVNDIEFVYCTGINMTFNELNDLTIDYCLIQNGSVSVISNENIRITNSTFSSGVKAVNIDYSYGELVFNNNIFTNFEYAIYVNNTSLTNLNVSELSIQNNEFTNISNLAIALNYSDLKETGEDLRYSSVKINTNIFKNVLKCVWYPYITTSGATFNYNIIHYKVNSADYNPYVVRGAGNYTTYTIDCSKNLYLTSTGDISSYSAFIYNNPNNNGKYAVNYASQYSTISSYLEAVGTLSANAFSEELELNEQFELNVSYTKSYESIRYITNNEEVAVVSDTGVISAVNEGNAIITIIIDTEFGLITKDVYVTVINNTDGLYELKELLASGNRSDVYYGKMTYYGYYNYSNNVLGSVNNYYFGNLPSINDTTYKLDLTNRSLTGGVRKGNIEFITIHDTGSSYASSTAANTANYTANDPANKNSSWQYVVDENYIYQIMPDNYISYHAGDGGFSTTLYSTGIAVKDVNNRPVVTVGKDGYYYLDGVKSTLKASTNTASSSATITSSSPLPELGIPAVIKNGYYYIPTVYYNSDYGVYGIRGGGSSIGIETAVNNGSDIYQTWHYTAKLTANLLVKYNLTPDRVLFHNNYSGKNCPMTMINNGKVDEFLDMIYLEYYLAKNYSGYTITFTSSNTTLVDNSGRLIAKPMYTTYVPYTITISNGSITETITLTAVVKGTVK